MLYDFACRYSPAWLAMSESIFGEFGLEPHFAVGGLGDKESKGNYRRVKKRLGAFLEATEGNEEPDIRIDSRWTNADEMFFPCDIRIAFNETGYGLRNGVVAVRQGLVGNVAELVERIGELVFSQTGVAYGHAFDFPAAFGPDYYLSAVGAIPSGYSTLENEVYEARITRWRDNTWHHGLRPSQGYLREVYPVNFVLQSHLEKMVIGRPFSEYMASVGQLTQLSSRNRMYRWDVDEEKLLSVRNELESSGLVLSAAIDNNMKGK